MGAALGAAILMPWAMAMSIFIALGLGLALPILIFSFTPALARLLPRPGPWMESFKQLMAFPLYLAVVWLVLVLARQTDANGLAAVLTGLVALAFGLWLYGKSGSGSGGIGALLRRGTATVAVVLALGALAVATRFDGPSVETSTAWWEAYSPVRLAELQADPDVAVFVNMTADWCLTCKVNEGVALNQEVVREAFEAQKVVYMKGDWTRQDAAITDYLAEFGRNGVPLYVVYPRGGGEPRVLPQVLTPGLVVDVLESL
jgi:thiol:disulfide interchange protein DsbD